MTRIGCRCGDKFGIYGKANESECSNGCYNDSNEKCGGFSRNNIYEISCEILNETSIQTKFINFGKNIEDACTWF